MKLKQLIIIIAFIQLNYTATGQALIINGELVDKEQIDPVPYVHLAVMGTSIGTTSNSEGKFSLTVPKEYLKDSLLFSCVGYETLKLPVGQLLSGYQKLYLKKATITLQPVVVSALSAKDLIRKSINKIPENYVSSPTLIRGYYLSATKEGNKFVRLHESSLNLYNENPSVNKQYVFLSYNGIKKSEDYRTYPIESPGTITKALFFDHVTNRKGFLNAENLDSWDFKIEGLLRYNKNDVLIIQADYITDVTKMEHTAKIYLNPDSYAILKVEYNYNWYSRNFKISAGDSITTDYRNWEGVFYYTARNNKYLLRSFNFKVTQGIYDKLTGNLITTQQINNEFIINEVEIISQAEGNQFSIPDQKNIDFNKRDGNLKQHKLEYPVESALYKQIIRDLEGYK